ncbi:MAG: 16S rRNA (cytidine(1402)-2'-O)-methyltransferase [Bdellovibrionota bacterium]
MTGTLYIIATPIGNLGDISYRAIETLKLVDIIAAEDTRKSLILLNKYNIKKPVFSNHKFNEASKLKFFIDKLLLGENIGLISDAGMPCISDPGYILVKEAIENNIATTCVPGASASITSVSLSGFDTSSFSFLGFLPRDKKGLLNIFNKISLDTLNNVFIFYESPKRIIKTIEFLNNEFPNFSLCLCNDLTKKFEKIYRGSPSKILNELKENEAFDKGEYVLVVNTNIVKNKNNNIIKDAPLTNTLSIEALLVDYLIKNKNETLKTAIKEVNSKYKNLSKNEIYKASLNLKNIL